MNGAEEITVTLTRVELNRLTTMLRDSAQEKKRRARQVHENDRADLEAAAMRDYELRKKLIGVKAGPQEDG